MLAAFSVTPLGAGEPAGDHVAEGVRTVRAGRLSRDVESVERRLP